jgi:oligoendopeptidase F
MNETTIGSEKVRWDLSPMYSGVEDPRIDIDIKSLIAMFEDFKAAYKGKLKEKLGAAIEAYASARMLEDKIMLFLYLKLSADVSNAAVKAKLAGAERALSQASGENMAFFPIELVAIEEGELAKLYSGDDIVARHRPWIEHTRLNRPHLLSEPVESALTKRAPFGPSAWSEFFDELEADIETEHQGVKKTLTELLHLLSESKEGKERAALLGLINDSLKGTFAKYSAQTLYMVTGASSVENRERSYKNPMQARNKDNRVPDEAVDMLHSAIKKEAGPLAKRYYRLKAALLGLKTLRWSDRNAPMPFSDTTVIPFTEAKAIVLDAYERFSPELARLVTRFFDEKRIDAPAARGKRGGAFNYSVVLPGNAPVSYILLNYLGSSRDVMTLAHELGHGVHGLLAGKKQGPLMSQAPIAFAETASVFGEATTFQLLKERLEKKGEKKSLLALLMGKIDDILNTSVRQISFSNFERRIHGMDPSYRQWQEPVKLSVQELNSIWLDVTKEFYGPEGEVFTYENAEHLWSYISHFHRPFYVYGYALGEILTQSLYAQKARLGERFEPLYLDLLSSGSTRNLDELLRPFGLDPADEAFWTGGIKSGLGELVSEAEEISGLV